MNITNNSYWRGMMYVLRWLIAGRRRWLLLAVAALLIGWYIYHLGSTAQQAQQRNTRGGAQSSVGSAVAAPGTLHVYVNALGTVTPLANVTVTSQVSGQLQQIFFKEGQMVKKGDVLAQIDPRPYEALKAQYEGQLAKDQSLLAQAKTDNERYQTLLKQDSIARQTAEDQAFVVKQYEGAIRADQALIDAQVLNLTYTKITAPIDGRVGLRLVDEGNLLQATSSSGIATITQLSPISVLFAIPEDRISDIAPQIMKGDNLAATVYDRSNTKQLAVGAVTALDNQIDTTTGTAKLRAQFDNESGALFPNQFVNVRILAKTIDKALVVPTAAIQRGAPGTFVYVIDDSKKVAIRVVATGASEGDLTQVTTGLAAGERVVTSGADRLRDGAQVNLAEDAAATPPAGAATGSDGTKRGPGNGGGNGNWDPTKRHKREGDGASAQPAAPADGKAP